MIMSVLRGKNTHIFYISIINDFYTEMGWNTTRATPSFSVRSLCTSHRLHRAYTSANSSMANTATHANPHSTWLALKWLSIM